MKLASLYELQTQYDVKDLYDMLEILDVHGTIVEEHHRKSLPKENK